MYWPKFNYNKLMRKLRVRKNTSGGISCFYVQWTKQAGLKVYRSAKERNLVMRRQARASEHGLGPLVGKAVDFEVCRLLGYGEAPQMEPLKLFAFFTEHLTVARRRRVPKEIFDSLDCDLQRVGIHHSDLHANNVGRKGKKLVCIDFGTESCQLGRAVKHSTPYAGNCSDSWDTFC